MIYIINSFMGNPNIETKINKLDRFIFSLYAYQRLSKLGKVIVCESSSFNWAKFITNKNIIFINTNQRKFESRGKGEIETLKSCLPYIKNEEIICKITSKFFPIFDHKIVTKNNKFEILGVITGMPFRPQVDTRFLIMKKNIFLNKFLNIQEEINDQNNKSLEIVLFQKIINEKIIFKPLNFKLFGMNGHDGKFIKKSYFKSFFWYLIFYFRLKFRF